MTARKPKPFGEPVLPHQQVALLLGVSRNKLTQMPLRRAVWNNCYIYDPAEIVPLAEKRRALMECQK